MSVMQMEFDRERVKAFSRVRQYGVGQSYTMVSAYTDCQSIAAACLKDTFEHGGTFVCVVGPEKITLIQREVSADLEEPA